jgi:hypothetical protein
MWHGHFDKGTDEQVAEECAGFLDDLFNDRVVVWVLSGKSGGLFYPGAAAGSVRSGFLVRGGGPPPGSRASTWSGPWLDDGSVARG